MTDEISIQAIPYRMKSLEQWLCWEAAMRDGKETKIPKKPGNTDEFAATDDPSTWGSFTEANESPANIGFVFTDDDDIVGIDLDDCRDPETGEWDDWALDILETVDGWAEISPSGTGAHILVKGSLPEGKNRKGDIEIYEDGRFFTVTADLINKHGERITAEQSPKLEERQEELEEVHEKYLADEDDDDEGGKHNKHEDVDVDFTLDEHRGSKSSSHGGMGTLSPEDQKIVRRAKAAKNGRKFTALWRGDWKSSHARYESQSEADMAFAEMLAFWCGNDIGQMDRIFRASGLMREKWRETHYSDGSTYGEKTLAKAAKRTDNVYEPEENDDTTPSHENTSESKNEDDESSKEAGEVRRERGQSTIAGDIIGSEEASEDNDTTDRDTQTTLNGKRASGDIGEARRSRSGRSVVGEMILDGDGDGSDSDGRSSDSTSDSETEEQGHQTNSSADEAARTETEEVEAEEVEVEETEAEHLDRSSEKEQKIRELTESEEEIHEEEDSGESLFSESSSGDTKDGKYAAEDGSADASSTQGETTTEAQVADSNEIDEENIIETDKDEHPIAESDEGVGKKVTENDSTSATGNKEVDSSLEKQLSNLQNDFEQFQSNVSGRLETLTDEIRFEDDKIQRMYQELQLYEEALEKREQQMEALRKTIILLCKARDEQMFENIAQELEDNPIQSFSDRIEHQGTAKSQTRKATPTETNQSTEAATPDVEAAQEGQEGGGRNEGGGEESKGWRSRFSL